MAESTLVLVLTDVEGSTRLWQQHPDVMVDVMTRHHQIVHESISQHGGWRPVDQGEGDAVFAAFDSAAAAVTAVLHFQRQLAAETWPREIRIRDRVGIHVGQVEVRNGNLFGVAVSRAARIRSLGAGGQVLASAPVIDLFGDQLPDGATVRSLGEQRLKDLARPERVFQVVGPGMESEFPPLTSLDRTTTNLPVQTSSFVGRRGEVADLTSLFGRQRLITITGFGGVGKTRLAMQVAAELADGDGDGVWFVDLAAVDDVAAVPTTIAAAVGVEDGGGEVLEALAAWLASKRVLLVLDNLEQLLPDVTETVELLLGAGPGVHLLATCREPLRLQGEQVFALEPLPVPDLVQDGSTADLDRLRTSPAVELFLSRARAARRDFALTAANAEAVAGICVRIDGLPLAIELVAARVRGMSVQALLSRLNRALPLLAGGGRSLPARHQTMRATIVWSTQSLSPELQTLLHRMSVFPGPFTLEVAEAVLGDVADADIAVDVFGGLLELVDRSLVRLRPAGPDDEMDRYDLLVPIREYAWEQLTRHGDADRMRDLHADHYARLTLPSGDLTREDRDRLFALVHDDWPNLAAALDRLHERGDAATEVLVAPWIARGLQEIGRDAQALSLLRDVVGHLTPDDLSTTAGIAVVRLAMIEFQSYQSAAAVETLRRARAIVAANPDPALVVLAAALNSRLGDPLGEDPALIERAGDVLASLREHGNAIPRWTLAEQWVYAFLAGELPLDSRLRREQDRLLTETRGADQARQRINVATFLIRRRLFDEAETLMRFFLDETVLSQASPATARNALLCLAELYMETQRIAEARDVLQRAEDVLRLSDAPNDWAVVNSTRAVVDRALGAPDEAVRRLDRLLDRIGETEVPWISAVSHWLSAVLARERGDADGAMQHLRLSWVTAEAEADPVLVLVCLAERAAQLVSSDPARAMAYWALVVAHDDNPVMFLVEYEKDLLPDLERSIGVEAVAAAMQDAVGAPLTLPTWEE